MSLNIQANTQFIKLVTHNSTDKIVERSKVNANEASIGHHLVSVKNSDNNLKITEMVKKIITEEDKILKKYISTITKNITIYEKKKQNIENEIARLENKISNGNSTKSHRSGIHNNIMVIKQAGNQQKLENLNNQLKANSEILGKLRDEQHKTANYKESIEYYLSKTSPEMQNEFFSTFSKSEINTPKIQSMFEEKLQPLLNKRDKYVAALNTLSDIQSGKPAEKTTVIPAAQRESSPPHDAVSNRKVSVAEKAEVTPAPQQQVKETVSKGTREATKSAISAPPPMPTESTHPVASPALAGPTIPVPPPMPKGESSLAASSLLSEQKTTPASLKEAQFEEVKREVVNEDNAALLSGIRQFDKGNLKKAEIIEKQKVENDERATLLSSIRQFSKENLKKAKATEKQPTAESDDADKSTLQGVLKARMRAMAPDDDSGIDNTDFDEWDD
ncbi:hypothetical protein SGGMMB4_01407 [Sodalis glossinidius str. 'morsitans']|uniref:WH2 domain-containing protein n=1 Tax=Sodalis glossinidius (strain morsitans) TaxID=343509 RepID=A0A193QGR4_SODGM|nr:WH2 domain-containing protein [Sodalis glossinidius]CRL44346.1 hypothetical protein SGGMMB4_01407 [Sodalis glossinidius str. 'morsitans']